MTKLTMDDYTNIASSLREIAANSDKSTGKILKKIQKASKNGLGYIEIKVSEADLNSVTNLIYDDAWKTPMIEKLSSLGFKFRIVEKLPWYKASYEEKKKYLRICW